MTRREVDIFKHLLGRLVELQQQTPGHVDITSTYVVFQAVEAIRVSEVTMADPEWA